MNINFGNYILDSGWGGIGFYDADKAIGIEKIEDVPVDRATGLRYFVEGRHIIPEDAIICGTGSGYEEFITDEKICQKIIELLSEEGLSR